MQAWQYVGDNQPIALNDVAEPVAGPGELVIDVRGSGICHSDIGYLDGTISNLLPGGPVTLGHEVAGVVSEVGAGVADFSLGDRVAIKADLAGPGTGRDGGFAAKVAAQRELVVRVPEGVPWDQAAVSTDGGMTSFHAVTVRAQVKAGEKVGIIGFGGLGSLGVQTALGLGAEVYVAEVNESLFPLIEAAGVSGIDTSITAFAGVGLDAVVDFAGYGTTTAQAIEVVRDRGRVVQVGLGVAQATINVSDLTVREIELLGSLGGDVDDNAKVLEMMAAGTLASRTTTIGFAEIGDAIERLRRGEVAGRLVVLIDGS
jgi:propanol-preferring alcohol dehydrogenase